MVFWTRPACARIDGMIALTKIKSQRLLHERRHPQIGVLEAPSGFGSDVTYVVGSLSTQLSAKSPIDRATPLERSDIQPLPESALYPGRQIGPFRLIKRLGQGAQGDVWKAKRLQPRVEIVALKVLNPALARLPNRLAQFRREAERGARLAGPSLLHVFEFGEIDGHIYMAMPLVEGTTLHQVIKGRQAYLRGQEVEPVHRLVTMDEENYLRSAVRIMAKAARALAQVHTNRVVHRDIKPANILLDYDRRCGVYLCDLGLGRDLEFATSEQMRDGAGTPMYMAPERLLKAPADEILCDIYSMGVTLYEAVTLDRPFLPPEGMPVNCLSVYLASTDPRRPSDLRPGLPCELEQIILKAISRDPHSRYRTAQELSAALDLFLVRWSFRNLRVATEPAHAVGHGPHLSMTSPRTTAKTGTG
jgi:serine/threonine-protein kinase